MAVRKPVVRHFIACEDVEVNDQTHLHSLRNVLHTIKLGAGASFPVLFKLTFFALLSDASGVHDLAIRVSTLDATGEEVVRWETKTIATDFGSDPLRVHQQIFRLPVRLPRPGRYDFHFLCGGEVVAKESLLFRENS